jgi:TPR repeat protein
LASSSSFSSAGPWHDVAAAIAAARAEQDMTLDELYLEGDAAYDRGDYATALDRFVRGADAGDGRAMSRLANMYEDGVGVDVDFERSVEWDLKAVAAGFETSLINLGIKFRRAGSMRKARYWFERALDKGDGEAALELAKLYSVSDAEEATARRYLQSAAEAGRLSQASAEEIERLSKLELSQW